MELDQGGWDQGLVGELVTVLVLASQALLIPYHEEGTLALASVGEGHTDTCILGDMESLPLTRDIATHTGAGVMLHSTGIRIGIYKVHWDLWTNSK